MSRGAPVFPPAVRRHAQVGRVADQFVADVANAVCDYCADGIDAFESCLSQATDVELSLREQLHKGSELLFTDLSARVDSSLSLFDQLCTSAVFSTPTSALQSVLVTCSRPAEPPASFESEQELDAKLAQLRQRVHAMDAECQQLKAQNQQLAGAVDEHGSMPSLHPLATTAATNKEAALADVSAIASAAQQLQPLLGKASALRSQREPLAARQNTSNLPGSDWRTSQQIKTTGSLEELRHLNKLLRPGLACE